MGRDLQKIPSIIFPEKGLLRCRKFLGRTFYLRRSTQARLMGNEYDSEEELERTFHEYCRSMSWREYLLSCCLQVYGAHYPPLVELMSEELWGYWGSRFQYLIGVRPPLANQIELEFVRSLCRS